MQIPFSQKILLNLRYRSLFWLLLYFCRISLMKITIWLTSAIGLVPFLYILGWQSLYWFMLHLVISIQKRISLYLLSFSLGHFLTYKIQWMYTLQDLQAMIDDFLAIIIELKVMSLLDAEAMDNLWTMYGIMVHIISYMALVLEIWFRVSSGFLLLASLIIIFNVDERKYYYNITFIINFQIKKTQYSHHSLNLCSLI